MTSGVRRPNYREEPVRALIEEYQAVRAKADTTRGGLRVLVQLADLGLALKQLSRTHREVVLLHGLVGLSQEDTAQLLQVSQKTISKRYRRALEEVTYHINGGIL